MFRTPATLSLLFIASASVAAENASARLVREVGEAYLQIITRENPQRRLKLGLPIEALPNVTLAGEEREAREGEALLARLGPVKREELSHEESLSKDVLSRQLSLRVAAPKSFYYRFQVTPYLSPLGAVGQILGGMPLATGADRERYLARLSDVPAMTASLVTKLQAQAQKGIRVPRPELDAVDSLHKAFAALGEASPFRPNASRLGATSEPDRAVFLKSVDSLVATRVAPAIAALGQALSGDYRAKAPEAVGLKQYPGGLEAYRAFVKLHTTMDVTPEQVHEIGLKNVARIDAEMTKIRESLGFKGTQVEFKESLRSNPRLFPKTPDEIGARMMSFVTRIEPEVDKFFGRRPQAPYGVRRLEPQLEPGQTFGYYGIPTATDPRGYYNYNGSSLSDRSLLNAGALIYHELWRTTGESARRARPEVRYPPVPRLDSRQRLAPDDDPRPACSGVYRQRLAAISLAPSQLKGFHMFRSMAVLALALTSLALSASAEDLTITFKSSDGGAATHYFSKDRIRMNSGRTDSMMEFSSGTMTLIDHQKKEYSEITLTEMDEMMKGVSAQMEQAMAQVPPQMREQMAKMMGGAAGEATVTKGETKTVAGYSCQTYTLTLGTSMTQELCSTTALTPPFDVANLQKMSRISIPMIQGMDKLFKKMSEIQGLSLMQHTTMSMMGRKTDTSMEATEVKKGAIAADVFAIPAGYKKVESPMKNMAKRGR